MGIIAEAVRHMISAGMSADAIYAAVQDMESATQQKDTGSDKRREKDRERKRLARLRNSADSAECPSPSNGSIPSDGFPHPSFPSLASLTPPKENPPTGVKRKTPGGFEKFWAGYPKTRAGSRDKAEGAYRRALLRATEAEIMLGLQAYAASREVADGFAAGAAAWLNDDRWTSDYSVVARSTSPPASRFPETREPPKKNALTL